MSMYLNIMNNKIRISFKIISQKDFYALSQNP